MRAILLAGGLSVLFTMFGTRYAIRVLASRGYGQLIRDDGPTTHHTKRGTPTMGGRRTSWRRTSPATPRARPRSC